MEMKEVAMLLGQIRLNYFVTEMVVKERAMIIGQK